MSADGDRRMYQPFQSLIVIRADLLVKVCTETTDRGEAGQNTFSSHSQFSNFVSCFKGSFGVFFFFFFFSFFQFLSLSLVLSFFPQLFK